VQTVGRAASAGQMLRCITGGRGLGLFAAGVGAGAASEDSNFLHASIGADPGKGRWLRNAALDGRFDPV